MHVQTINTSLFGQSTSWNGKQRETWPSARDVIFGRGKCIEHKPSLRGFSSYRQKGGQWIQTWWKSEVKKVEPQIMALWPLFYLYSTFDISRQVAVLTWHPWCAVKLWNCIVLYIRKSSDVMSTVVKIIDFKQRRERNHLISNSNMFHQTWWGGDY